jgi:hypothetical protein
MLEQSMHKSGLNLASAAFAATVAILAGCSSDAPAAEKIVPAVIDTIPDSKLKQVTLTADAAERISLVLGKIEAGEGTETVVPYGAVIYDPKGVTWAYVAKGDNVFIREELAVDRIEGDTAFLTGGPPVGTVVAVVGVAELFGAETGIGK